MPDWIINIAIFCGYAIIQIIMQFIELQAAEFIDVPDLYHFLVKEVSKSTLDCDIVTMDSEDGENNRKEIRREVSNTRYNLDCSK